MLVNNKNYQNNKINLSDISLIVDLDNTLINTDLLYESSLGVLKRNPFLAFMFPFWLALGKGYLKTQLAKRFAINVRDLPYNKTVINYIITNKNKYKQVILATASHEIYAFEIFKYFAATNKKKQQSLFNDFLASNKDFNLSGINKAQKLIELFGKNKFNYIGDRMYDLPVWEASNTAIMTNVSAKVIAKTKHLKRIILSKK